MDMRILDLATGTGWTARRLAERGFDVTGADFAPDMLSAAREFSAARGLDIPFVEESASRCHANTGSLSACGGDPVARHYGPGQADEGVPLDDECVIDRADRAGLLAGCCSEGVRDSRPGTSPRPRLHQD